MRLAFVMLLAGCPTLWPMLVLAEASLEASLEASFPEGDYAYVASSPEPGGPVDFLEDGVRGTVVEEMEETSSLDVSGEVLSLLTRNGSEDEVVLNETEGGGKGGGNGSGGFQPKYPILRDSLFVVIPVTLIYALILLIGLVGNVSTCVVIAKNNYMHTATNYYLFSLAVSDLLLLISGLPQEMYLIWLKWPYIFGEAFCLIRGLAAETSANATVLTITAFTVERYVAICHPLRSHKLSQLSRVVRGVLLIWVSALALALPQAAQFGVIDEEQGHRVVIKGAWCAIKRELIPYAFQISICVFFVIPMTIITALYVLIGLKLRRSRGPSRTNHELTVEPRNTNRHSQSHVIRMLVAVVVAFFICWAPFHIQRLMAIYSNYLGIASSESLGTLYKVINYVSGILYYVSTCINPILYHIMSNKFRQAFKDTMGQLFGRPTARVQHWTYSSISTHRASRMGVHHHLHHQNQFGSRRGEHQETCINCRHTPTMCSCRGNSQKYVRTYNLDQTGSDTTTVSLLSTSPSDKDPVIALASLDTSKGPRRQTPTSAKSQQPTGLKAFLSRRGRSRPQQVTQQVTQQGTQQVTETLEPRAAAKTGPGSSLNYHCETQSVVPTKEKVVTRVRRPPTEATTPQSPKENENAKSSGGGRLGMSGAGKKKSECSLFQVPPPPSQAKARKPKRRKMMLILSNKSKKSPTTLVHLSPGKAAATAASIGLGVDNLVASVSRATMIGVPVGTGGICVKEPPGGRIGSQTSVDSNNTISNSSLQDLDESEYTGEELAGVLAELKDSITHTQSPKII